jgi:lipoprotein-releasing system permease protein
MLRKANFQIGLVYNVGVFDVDSGLVMMPLQAAQSFFQTGDGVTELDVDVADPEADTDRIHGAIAALVGPQFHVIDWRQANLLYLNALDTERNVMFVILTLIILVAAFNIISSLIMLVKDKGRDIAILRTMGATRGMIMRIFFLNGACIGVVGTLLGLGLGILIAENLESVRQWIQYFTKTDLFSPEIYFLTHLPSVVEPREVLRVVLMALGLSFLATLYPAWRAARLDPVEALRYE